MSWERMGEIFFSTLAIRTLPHFQVMIGTCTFITAHLYKEMRLDTTIHVIGEAIITSVNNWLHYYRWLSMACMHHSCRAMLLTRGGYEHG